MPVHNWKKIYDGTFHHLHGSWIVFLNEALNKGLLPPEYFAISEQRAGNLVADILTLEVEADQFASESGGTAVLAPPSAVLKKTFDVLAYVNRQNSVVIRHISDRRIVAVLEVVSRGNKAGSANFSEFMEKAQACLRRGIHFSFVDVHAPGPFDPNGIHGEYCLERGEDPPELPPGKNLAAAGYEAGSIVNAYVNPFGVGDIIPQTPLFLRHNYYVMLPLEETYMRAYDTLPRQLKSEIESNRA